MLTTIQTIKHTLTLLTALLLAPLVALHAAENIGLPLADGAIFLDAEHARLLPHRGNGREVVPRLLPVADGDGFAATQALAPVAPTEGALAWTLEVRTAGRYWATLEFGHSRTGHKFELQVGHRKLTGEAPNTRGSMALLELGEIELPAGPQTVILRNTSAIEKAWMSVGSIYLRPASQLAMTKPQIRAAIARLKPRALPTELLVPAVFSDHMVLQREMPVPVWGRAAPGANITVRFRGQTKQTKTDADGRWLVRLDAMEAGGPFEMEISDGKKAVRLVDVLVGEVWFGSGQSNMEVSVKFLPPHAQPDAPFECDADTKQLLESGVHPHIRLSAVTRDHHKTPAWFALAREDCLDVPALMTSVAVLLRAKLNVPIGIIVRCESSTPSGVWLSRDAVEGDPDIQRQLREYAANEYPKLVAGYSEKLKAWEAAVAKAQAEGKKSPVKPNAPALAGHVVVGNFFSEGRFESYGANYLTRIAPVIPFAVRGVVWDQGESGTGLAGADQSAVMPALVRSWRAAWSRDELPFIYVDKRIFTPADRDALAKLPATARADYQGLSTINHPPDKAAYARRIVEQMGQLVYRPVQN